MPVFLATGVVRGRRCFSLVVGVLLAAAGVFVTGSPWPDVAVGLLIAAMFVTSALSVGRDARHSLQRS